jgi:hypothetical protein
MNECTTIGSGSRRLAPLDLRSSVAHCNLVPKVIPDPFNHFCHSALAMVFPLFPVADSIVQVLRAGHSKHTTVFELPGKRDLEYSRMTVIGVALCQIAKSMLKPKCFTLRYLQYSNRKSPSPLHTSTRLGLCQLGLPCMQGSILETTYEFTMDTIELE